MNGEILFSTYKPVADTTAYIQVSGKSPFGNKVNLFPPYYAKTGRKAAVFALILNGKHISSFFTTRYKGWFTGDYRRNGMIIHMTESGEVELWVTDIPVHETVVKFATGELSGRLYEARIKNAA